MATRDETALSMWTVYDHPLDFPDHYIARQFRVDKDGAVPTPSFIQSTDLSLLRDELMHMGLTPIARSPGDDAKIIETWI